MMDYVIVGAALALVGWIIGDMRTPLREASKDEQHLTAQEAELDLFLATYWAEHPDEKPH